MDKKAIESNFPTLVTNRPTSSLLLVQLVVFIHNNWQRFFMISKLAVPILLSLYQINIIKGHRNNTSNTRIL